MYKTGNVLYNASVTREAGGEVWGGGGGRGRGGEERGGGGGGGGGGRGSGGWTKEEEEEGMKRGKVWKLAEQDWICPDREPGPGPDLRALLSLTNASPVSPSLPSLKKKKETTINPSLPRLLDAEPLSSDSSLSFPLQTSKHTLIHTSVILHRRGVIEVVRQNPGCWPSK